LLTLHGGPPPVTFARFARLLAVVLVAFALWRMRPPAEPPRVAVVALPGATQELVFTEPAREGEGAIRLPPGTSGASFWRHLVAVADGDGADASASPPLWTGDRAPVRVDGAPARLFLDRVRQDADAAFFLGSSSGAVVEADDITSGRLPFPYDRTVDAVAAAVESLGRDQWSEWIPVPSAPGAGCRVPARALHRHLVLLFAGVRARAQGRRRRCFSSRARPRAAARHRCACGRSRAAARAGEA
jgi:hypothetical protein